jgi:hypothetical protein
MTRTMIATDWGRREGVSIMRRAPRPHRHEKKMFDVDRDLVNAQFFRGCDLQLDGREEPERLTTRGFDRSSVPPW